MNGNMSPLSHLESWHITLFSKHQAGTYLPYSRRVWMRHNATASQNADHPLGAAEAYYWYLTINHSAMLSCHAWINDHIWWLSCTRISRNIRQEPVCYVFCPFSSKKETLIYHTISHFTQRSPFTYPRLECLYFSLACHLFLKQSSGLPCLCEANLCRCRGSPMHSTICSLASISPFDSLRSKNQTILFFQLWEARP